MQDTLIDCVTGGGRVLMEHFGKVRRITRKESQSSVVTEADVAAERVMVDLVRSRYPDHNIVAEESGFQNRNSPLTWVIDPLDGTSNFAAGVPWFGVLAAVLDGGEPVAGVMYLPCSATLYACERGGGAFRDGERVRVSAETELSNVLCAYSLDVSGDAAQSARDAELFRLLVKRSRNFRSANCLLDFCYTIDGRYGACVNQACRIWDIAAPLLMMEEAGGLFTGPKGEPLRFELDAEITVRDFTVVGGNPSLHAQVLALVRQSLD